MPRITCDSCNGQRGYSSGGYNQQWNTCKDCSGTGIDVEATLKSLEAENAQLKQGLEMINKIAENRTVGREDLSLFLQIWAIARRALQHLGKDKH